MTFHAHQHQIIDSKSIIFSYFLIGAMSGAGFQFGMFGIRKIVSMITSSNWYNEHNWKHITDTFFFKYHHWCTVTEENKAKVKKEEHREGSIQNNISSSSTSSVVSTSSQTEKRRNRSVSIGSYTSQSHPTSVASTTSTSEKRYLELLVHNVAHTDLVLSLGNLNPSINDLSSSSDSDTSIEFLSSDPDMEPSDSDKPIDLTLCRPRFSAFSLFSKRILSSLLHNSNNNASPQKSKHKQHSIISFPRYERKDSPRYTLVTPRPSRQILTPVGFHLTNPYYKEHLKIDTNELSSLRIRGRDCAKIPELDDIMKLHHQTSDEERLNNSSKQENQTDTTTETKYYLNAIFFPLIASLMARWEDSMKKKFSSKHSVKKVVVLVSGVGK